MRQCLIFEVGKQMQKKDTKAGVFGWLGILVFAMLVLWPLLLMIELRNTLLTAALDFPQLQERYTWYYFRTAMLFVVLTSAAISMIGGGMLLKRRTHSSVFWAILALWISGPIGQAFSFALPYLMYDHGTFTANIMRHADSFIGSIVVRLACTAYLLMSSRVKLTYPKKGQPLPEDTDD